MVTWVSRGSRRRTLESISVFSQAASAALHRSRLQMIETQVLIVGAGPVGLTLAMDLAWRGIDVTIAELRHAGEPPSVKCNQLSARSMEIFRRLGIATQVRALGLPEDY